jgi:membrane-associated phospholipid phosphatase
MGLSLVYLGEHYVIDVIAGIGTAFVAVYLAEKAMARFSSRAGAAQAVEAAKESAHNPRQLPQREAA